jgi:hypothetical protein
MLNVGDTTRCEVEHSRDTRCSQMWQKNSARPAYRPRFSIYCQRDLQVLLDQLLQEDLKSELQKRQIIALSSQSISRIRKNNEVLGLTQCEDLMQMAYYHMNMDV